MILSVQNYTANQKFREIIGFKAALKVVSSKCAKGSAESIVSLDNRLKSLSCDIDMMIR